MAELSEEAKKNIMESFLESISTIADEEYQRRIWIKGLGPECDSFDEFYDYFFNEGDAIIKNYKFFGITKEQYVILKNFRNELKLVASDYYWPPEFIDKPEWKRIIAMAQEVLDAFNYSKNRR